jgi:hypothetical protein
VGWSVAGALIVLGLPLFLRMPLWIDTTLYDVAARTVLSGGTHYKDVFDTNPPGFVWCLCLLRPVIGPSSEALRAVDFLIVSAVVVLLIRWARAGGATAAGAGWAVAGMAGFYLFVSEFNHCQRDVWMMLPAGLGAMYRLTRTSRARREAVTNGWVFRTAVLEGIIWGLAAWIKPHIILVAACVWLVVQGRLAGSAIGPGWPRLRRSLADLSGALVGGVMVGAAGAMWLVMTGTWGPFLEVFTEWNTSYFWKMISQIDYRLEHEHTYFPPWSILVFVAVPVAILNVIDARPWAAADTQSVGLVGRLLPSWLHSSPADPGVRFTRGVLAALYLGWLGVAVFLQKEYHYVHVPETILMLALLAANRWALVVPALALQFGVMIWVAMASPGQLRWCDYSEDARTVIWAYPERAPNRLVWWAGCFARNVPGELRNGVSFQSDHFGGIDWVEFPEVEEFLRSQNVHDGEVICWHDATHPLYLRLRILPGIRFMHISTICAMEDYKPVRAYGEVEAAAESGRVRFIVTDLVRETFIYPPSERARTNEPGPSPDDLLPLVIPPIARTRFPFDQPTVFRSGDGHGRYVVHKLTKVPVGRFIFPGVTDKERPD